MKYNRIYNEDSSAYLDIMILGEYNNAYDGTETMDGRVTSPYQINDKTNFDEGGDLSTYTVTTIGNRVSVDVNWSNNELTDEKLNAFFKTNDITFYEDQSTTKRMLLKDNNGSYPKLMYHSYNDSGFPRKLLFLMFGDWDTNNNGIILIDNMWTSYTTEWNGYTRTNTAQLLYLGLPTSIKNLAKMWYDLGRYSSYTIWQTDGTSQYGCFSTTLSSSELKHNSTTIGTLTLAYYDGPNQSGVMKAWETDDSMLDYANNIEEGDIPDGPTDDSNTYNDTDGEDGQGRGPSTLPTGETIEKNTSPSLSPISLGIYNIYKMSVGQFQNFKANLWNSDIMDYLTRIWQSNPMDSILSVALAPFTPETIDAVNISIGSQTLTDAQGRPLTRSYETFDFSLNYDEKISTVWGNKYDYDGVTYNLFVPFVGYQKLNVNDIYHKNLELNYIIETLTGNGICYLYSKPQEDNFDTLEKARPTYSWSFNCYSKIPLSSRNLDGFITSIAGGVGGVLSGNLGGVATLATARPVIQKSGEMKANTSYIGYRRPFLICEYSNLFIKNGQYKKQGRPSWRYTTLSNCSGFTKCKDAQVPASDYITETEQKEINNLLNEGVII